MTPLSIEKASLGRPAMFHAWILIGSPRVRVREKSLEQGIFLSCKTSAEERMRNGNGPLMWFILIIIIYLRIYTHIF